MVKPTMKTLHLDPTAGDQAALVTEEVDRLLREGKRVAVTVAEEQELLSPQQVAERLGFSRQHVMRLIDYGGARGATVTGVELLEDSAGVGACLRGAPRRERSSHGRVVSRPRRDGRSG